MVYTQHNDKYRYDIIYNEPRGFHPLLVRLWIYSTFEELFEKSFKIETPSQVPRGSTRAIAHFNLQHLLLGR